MRKFSYEITVEAQDESEADSKIRGLSLLTSCTIAPRHGSILPLTKQEERVIEYYRKGEKVLQIMNHCLQHPSGLDDLAEIVKTPKTK